MKKLLLAALLVVLVVSLTSCAAGPNELKGSVAPGGTAAGFWLGLWHGFISFFTFIVSLFNSGVNVYEVHNNGNWYNFGFIFGVMIFYGGSSGGAGSRARSRRRD